MPEIWRITKSREKKFPYLVVDPDPVLREQGFAAVGQLEDDELRVHLPQEDAGDVMIKLEEDNGALA